MCHVFSGFSLFQGTAFLFSVDLFLKRNCLFVVIFTTFHCIDTDFSQPMPSYLLIFFFFFHANRTFPGNEERFSSAMFSSEVKVEVGPTDHTSGSSSITTRNITNYPWDNQYLSGSLVALHCSGEYLAYAIKGKEGGI